MQELKMAQHDLAKCVKLDPKNKDARDLLAEVKSTRNWFGGSLSKAIDEEAAAETDEREHKGKELAKLFDTPGVTQLPIS